MIRRNEILRRLYAQAEAGVPIIGGGAGTGISAKAEEAGGVDLLVLYNTGRYRLAGRVSITGLFAYGDANQIVMEMAGEVLPVVTHTPVLAGVNATDPFRPMPVVLRQVKEVELIHLAREMDMLTTPYVFNEAEARAMVTAGAALVVAHVGLTTGGSIGAAAAMSLDRAIDTTLRIAEAARSVRKNILVICHSGPFDEPEHVAEALARMPGVNGFYGASSMERLPVERAIADQVRAFKHIRLKEAVETTPAGGDWRARYA
jgi:predicted TIM-barrel enzyme